MYYNSRYYDTDLKRFMSVDPWQGELDNPQTQNKYSYVGNNPMKYTDPTGEELMDALKGGAKKAKEFAQQVKQDIVQTVSDPIQAGINYVTGVTDGYSQTGSFVGEVSVNPQQVTSEVIQGTTIRVNNLLNQTDTEIGATITGATLGAMYNAVGGKRLSNQEIIGSWSKGGFNNKVDSINYHVNKHGNGRSISEYTADGNTFYQNNSNLGKSHTIAGGQTGVKITNKSSNYYGIYDKSGRQVSHGPIRDGRPFTVE